ncbi:MAG: hypothetical protein ACRD1T_10775, partial [Acidimicrobiia bacterium]
MPRPTIECPLERVKSKRSSERESVEHKAEQEEAARTEEAQRAEEEDRLRTYSAACKERGGYLDEYE